MDLVNLNNAFKVSRTEGHKFTNVISSNNFSNHNFFPSSSVTPKNKMLPFKPGLEEYKCLKEFFKTKREMKKIINTIE